MTEQIEKALAALKDAGLKLNQNDTRIIRELVTDLARRGRQPHDIISSSPIAEMLADKKLNGPQKTARLKTILNAERYPAYTKAETAFWAEVKKLRLHPKIKISHTPFFEDRSLTVEFSCKDPEELRRINRSLERLAGKDLVKDALEAAENPN
jgi:hypothetical protein